MKIAVIGSGISGLSAAYYLSKKHKVDLFEKEDRFGGHSHTLDISTDNQSKKRIPVDIGFIVFNKHTYPNLINFFNEIGIDIEKSNMSLSFLVKEKNLVSPGDNVVISAGVPFGSAGTTNLIRIAEIIANKDLT